MQRKYRSCVVLNTVYIPKAQHAKLLPVPAFLDYPSASTSHWLDCKAPIQTTGIPVGALLNHPSALRVTGLIAPATVPTTSSAAAALQASMKTQVPRTHSLWVISPLSHDKISRRVCTPILTAPLVKLITCAVPSCAVWFETAESGLIDREIFSLRKLKLEANEWLVYKPSDIKGSEELLRLRVFGRETR